MNDTRMRQWTPLTIRADGALLDALDTLSLATGASRHAVLLLAAKKGVGIVTHDELRATLPGIRRRTASSSG